MAATNDDLIKWMRALAAGDEGPDADRARKMIVRMGGDGTPEDARNFLDSVGEPAGDAREQQRDEINARMGGVTSSSARGIHWARNGHDRVFPILTHEQARANLVRRAGAGDLVADEILTRIRGRR